MHARLASAEELPDRRGELLRVLDQERVPRVRVEAQLRAADPPVQQRRVGGRDVAVELARPDQRGRADLVQARLVAAVGGIPAPLGLNLAVAGSDGEWLASSRRVAARRAPARLRSAVRRRS
jgi:hypothetical protein